MAIDIEAIKAQQRFEQDAAARKIKRIDDNLAALREKSRELNKPIPEELLMVTMLETTVGFAFAEKYKEWWYTDDNIQGYGQGNLDIQSGMGLIEQMEQERQWKEQ